MDKAEELKTLEKEKRKEVAKTRIFWFLVVLNIVLVGYIVIQIILLTGAK